MRYFCPACQQRFAQPADRCPRDGWLVVEDHAGQTLNGRYELKRLIGVGGMGSTVWLARQAQIDRPVAVKLLPPREDNSLARQRFEREARIASNLRHPNIVTIYDYGSTEDGKLFLAMEYLEGRTVEQLLKQAARERPGEPPMDVRKASHLLSQALRALTHAHGRKVVHRDLKPSNLFVSPTGDDPDFLKVLDFGLAKYFSDDDAQAGRPGADMDVTGQRHVICGTPSYMAPEQWRGQIDARTDLYALGVILFRMLSGQLPFAEKSDFALYQAVISSPAPTLADRCERLGEGAVFEEVVQTALAKDPDLRFESARAMRAAIEETLGLTGRSPDSGLLSVPPPRAAPERPEDPEAVYLIEDYAAVTPSVPSLSAIAQQSAPEEPDDRRAYGLWLLLGLAGLVIGVAGSVIVPRLWNVEAPTAPAAVVPAESAASAVRAPGAPVSQPASPSSEESVASAPVAPAPVVPSATTPPRPTPGAAAPAPTVAASDPSTIQSVGPPVPRRDVESEVVRTRAALDVEGIAPALAPAKSVAAPAPQRARKKSRPQRPQSEVRPARVSPPRAGIDFTSKPASPSKAAKQKPALPPKAAAPPTPPKRTSIRLLDEEEARPVPARSTPPPTEAPKKARPKSAPRPKIETLGE